MPTTHAEPIATDAGWDEAVPILRQLWSDADEAFVRSWREEADYRLFGLYEVPDERPVTEPAAADDRAARGSGVPARPDPGLASLDRAGRGSGVPARSNPGLASLDRAALVAVAGVSIQRVLHHARHAWIHDFVVDEPRRGEGLGAELLAWVEDWARERDCESVALACRAGNDGARRFYEREGLAAWGQVLEREL